MMLVAVMFALAGLAGAADQLEVTLDRDQVSVVRGDRFTTESTITNHGVGPTTPLKVHLNVASLTGQVSVDPEDWSATPIRDLPALAPGESTSISWDIKAGDIGSFALYLVFLPAEPGGTSVSSTPMYVKASGRNTLDDAGTLPVVVTIPVLLGAAAATARWRFRRAE
nr:hypothetical protein [Kibdelosporangium sp. MJ126-NF4]CEL21710.1 hypothetical protein [Kibdelosporangium sp. MJ126-NF4]CTQ92491.1 hypothetical protein [Kibdelosporangium sp. MJ126-NF4]